MLDTRLVRITFPFIAASEQTRSGFADFPGTVRHADTALSGFDISFGNGEHPIEGLIINTAGPFFINIPVGRVNVTATMSVRDSSRGPGGNIDDPYGGFVDILVIADLF